MIEMLPDAELLERYVQAGDEQAFRELVELYVNLVFSTARRTTGDAHASEDIAQTVFTRLAKSARKLRPNSVLASWLHSDARLVSCHDVPRSSHPIQRQRHQINSWTTSTLFTNKLSNLVIRTGAQSQRLERAQKAAKKN